MKTIDVHAHIVPPEIIGSAGEEWGPEIIDHGDARVLRVGKYEAMRMKPPSGGDQLTRKPGPEGHIEQMDAKGWDIHVVSPTVLFFMYEAPPEIAVPFAQRYNDLLAEFCSAYPERLYFHATLPIQDIEQSVKEVDRTAALGARGIFTGATDLAGRNLDSKEFDPIWAKMVEHGLPLSIHGCPAAVRSGAGDPYLMTSFVGTVADETSSFCHMVFGGVFDRFPDLKVYISHGGGFIPYQVGRFEAQAQVMTDGQNKKPVRDYFENFYFDLLLCDRPAQKAMLDTFPIERILTGDNFGGADGVDAIAILDELDLPLADKEKVLATNATALYNLP